MKYQKGDAFILLLCIIVVVTITLGVLFDRMACHAKAQSFDNVSWGPVQGCLVEHRGRWLPLENIRGFDDKG